MKTQPTPITDLNLGDKIYVPWPKDREKPEWFLLPEVVTVKRIELPSTVIIAESGGLCLKETSFQKVMGIPTPESGDLITFDLDHYDSNGLKGYKEHTAIVKSTCYDPMKVHPPKCIVTVEGEDYGIPFSEVKHLEKKATKELSQLELFS